VPGWPFNSTDGKFVIVTTYDKPADRGYVELLDSANLSDRRVIEVPSELLHALPLRDGKHALVALANGEMARIDLDSATLVDGGFSAGGTIRKPCFILTPRHRKTTSHRKPAVSGGVWSVLTVYSAAVAIELS
jgi:hypothetical protein